MQTPLNLAKIKAIFFKQRGHGVTSTSEEYINTKPDLSIYDLLGTFSNIIQVITPSGQTIIDYEVAEDSDLSVYHLCNASPLPFLSNTELL